MRTRTSAFEARHLPPGRGEIRDVKYNDQVDTRLGREERNLSEVGEPHEVAVGVDEEGGGEVTGADEQQGGIHPEDCCVRELKLSNKNAHIIQKQNRNLEHGDEKRSEDRFSLLDPLHHVVEVGHAKEEGTNNYCLGRDHLKNIQGRGVLKIRVKEHSVHLSWRVVSEQHGEHAGAEGELL